MAINNWPLFQCERKTLAKLIKESNLLIRILTSSVCQFKHAGSDKQREMKSRRVFTSVFQILNFRRTISAYFQDVSVILF